MRMRFFFLLVFAFCFVHAAFSQFTTIKDPEAWKFRGELGKAIQHHNIAKMDSMYQFGVNHQGCLTFHDHVTLQLLLQKFDGIEEWLLTVELPDSNFAAVGSSYPFFPSPLWMKVNKHMRGGIILDLFIKRIDAELQASETKAFLTLFVLNDWRTFFEFSPEQHAEFNRKVIQFIQSYPNSRFRTLVGKNFNAEMEATHKSVLLDLEFAPGILQDLSNSAQLTDGFVFGFGMRVSYGFKKNFYSILWSSIHSPINTITWRTATSVNRWTYNRAAFRYDRLIKQSEHFDLFAFGDIGHGLAHAYNDINPEIQSRPSNVSSVTGGVVVQWNFIRHAETINVDDRLNTSIRYIGLECAAARNFHSFSKQNKAYIYLSLHMGMKFNYHRKRPNSAFN